MATVTGITAEKMQEYVDENIVGGTIVGDNLVLLKRDLSEVVAGNVRGPIGLTGATGPTSIVICTSITRPSTGLFEGLRIYETDTDSEYQYSGAAWLYVGPKLPHKALARVDIAGSGTTTSSAYSDLPSGLSIPNFNKRRADTSLFVTISGSTLYIASGHGGAVGVDIGGVDTDVAVTIAASGDANSNMGFSQTKEITGIAAGIIPLIKAQWKIYAGTMVQNCSWCLVVEEAFAS